MAQLLVDCGCKFLGFADRAHHNPGRIGGVLQQRLKNRGLGLLGDGSVLTILDDSDNLNTGAIGRFEVPAPMSPGRVREKLMC